jgi:hypothetical protein
MIATPTYDGKVGAGYTAAIAEVCKKGLAKGIDFVPVFICGDALIQRARNDLIALAVQSNVTDIIWIDADQEFTTEQVFALLNAPVDVVGGAVIKKSDEEQYNIKATPEQLAQTDEYGFYHVESIGTGFLRMSRKAFMYLWHNSEKYQDKGTEKRGVFEVKLQDGGIISEDVLVCQKLHAGGFNINLNPNITCSHTGTKTWHGDFASWLLKIKE